MLRRFGAKPASSMLRTISTSSMQYAAPAARTTFSSIMTLPMSFAPGARRVAHDVEPLVGGRLAVAMQQLAHAIDEDFRAAARNAVEAGGDQTIDDCGHGQLRQP